jgi:adenylate cyclase
MVERNAGLPHDRCIEFRIGVHLGDVVEKADGDLMGDAINIAARLEAICEPGAICLSEDAYRQARDKVQDEFFDLGEQTLKNIARPVRAYLMTSERAGKFKSAACDKTPAQLLLPDKRRSLSKPKPGRICGPTNMTARSRTSSISGSNH